VLDVVDELRRQLPAVELLEERDLWMAGRDDERGVKLLSIFERDARGGRCG
jgi:hypothetical protein